MASVEQYAITVLAISASSTSLLIVAVQSLRHLRYQLSFEVRMTLSRSSDQPHDLVLSARLNSTGDQYSSRITYRTSPLSIPIPNAVVAQMQLERSASFSARSDDPFHSLDSASSPAQVNTFLLTIIHPSVIYTGLIVSAKYKLEKDKTDPDLSI